MAVRPLCVMPHEVLRTVAAPITRFTKDVSTLVRDLVDTMHAHDGVGLAAPQIGCGVQVFVVSPSQRLGTALAVVNPILERTSGHAEIVEGCLSLPDVWDTVRRSASVRLRGQDPLGKPLRVDAEGLLAIVIQHELDHLKGRLFTDRVPRGTPRGTPRAP